MDRDESCAASFLPRSVHLDLFEGLWHDRRDYLFRQQGHDPVPGEAAGARPTASAACSASPRSAASSARPAPTRVPDRDHPHRRPPRGGRGRRQEEEARSLDRYDIDVKRCMFCGLCEEACPTKPMSIWLTTKTYETGDLRAQRALYFDKERLQSWEGVPPYPGVVSPDAGPDARRPTGAQGREGRRGMTRLDASPTSRADRSSTSSAASRCVGAVGRDRLPATRCTRRCRCC